MPRGELGFFLVLLIILLALVLSVYWQRRVARAVQARLADITSREPPLLLLNSWNVACHVARPGERDPRWRKCIIILTPGHLTVYDRSAALPEIISVAPAQLRWFGRPYKYGAGYNEIWLHVDDQAGWRVVKIRLYRDPMRQLVRALKLFGAAELTEAYRRRRPYIHYGPVTAHPAAQDIHGAWVLGEPVNLYLMPRFLVIRSGSSVLRAVPLEAVQQVGALRRLDAPGAKGLVRFRAEEETFAFALRQHEAIAAALAEAAKRTLETPIERKRKTRDDDYPDDEDSDGDPITFKHQPF